MSDVRIKSRLALALGLFVSVPLSALPLAAQTKDKPTGPRQQPPGIRVGVRKSGIRVGQGRLTGIRVGQGRKTGLRDLVKPGK